MPTLLAIHNYYHYRGGAEAVFLGHNQMFDALGWTVVPFSMQHPRNLDTPWSTYFVDELEFGEGYSLPEKLIRVPKVIYSFEARRKLRRLLEKVAPDICHVHNVYHHISPSILSLLHGRGIPIVLTLHDLKIACPAYTMLAHDGVCERCRGGRMHNVLLHRCIKGSTTLSAIVMVESILHRLLGSYLRCVDRFIVPSRFYLEKFSEWGMPRSRFRHVPNFVDVDRYRPAYEPGNHFVYFGRISREKGLTTLIRAAAAAGCQVQIIGTGPLLEELRELSVRVGADVVFSGYLSGAALHDEIRNARAVVLPSEWYENSPMSLLEAYALGKPVVGARIGGIPELIREGQTGLMFDSGDPESLAERLRALVSQSDVEIQEMGRRGRRWVETAFSASVYRNRFIEVYDELGAGSTLDATIRRS